jgi:adenosine kinase
MLDFFIDDSDSGLVDRAKLVQGDGVTVESVDSSVASEFWSRAKHDGIPGGAAITTCRVAQWMLKGLAVDISPTPVRFIGSVGGTDGEMDSSGEAIRAHLEKEGIEATLEVIDGAATTRCAILTSATNERTMIVEANGADLKVSSLSAAQVDGQIKASRYFYIPGFIWRMAEGIGIVIKLGRYVSVHPAQNCAFCMSFSSSDVVRSCRDEISACLQYVDFLFLNRAEARAFAVSKWGDDEMHEEEVAEKLAAVGKASGARPRVVLVTCGCDPTVIAIGGMPAHFKVPVEPLPSHEIVDTSGAGDAFLGGFVALLSRLEAQMDAAKRESEYGPRGGKGLGLCCGRRAIVECCLAGHYAAQQVLKGRGCSLPTECGYFEALPL